MNSFRNQMIGLMILFCLVAYSCRKVKDTPKPDTGQQIDVYVFGTAVTTTGPPFIVTQLPVYYKNGVSYSLSNITAQSCGIYALAVINNDIYAPGFFNQSFVFWKNTSQQPITNPDIAHISGMVTDGNNTYLSFAAKTALPGATVGQTGGYALNNNTLFKFTGNANGIVSSGSDIYCYGDTAVATPGFSPSYYATYYKNKIPVHLGDVKGNQESVITSMFISGNDVYASGYIFTYNPVFVPPLVDTAVYWKNGVMTVLEAKGYDAHTTAIAVKGSDVYIAGYINNGNWNARQMDYRLAHATLWKNGQPVTLSTGVFDSFTNNIVLSGNDVYVGGTETIDSAMTLYWKNGKPVTLKSPVYFGESGITVISK
jgi:hypothetical protein